MTKELDISRAMNAIRGVVRALRVNTRAIELELGISLAQLFVLQQLADKPADSLNDLAARTATHQSSVSVVVRRLVERGFVTRTTATDDKRRIRISLTPAGEELMRDAPRTVQEDLMIGMGKLTPAERATLADLLTRWVGGSGIDVVSPPMAFEDDAETKEQPA